MPKNANTNVYIFNNKMRRKIPKIRIKDEFYKSNIRKIKSRLIKTIISLVIVGILVVISRCFNPPIFVRLLFMCSAGFLILFASYNLIICILDSRIKLPCYGYLSNEIANSNILALVLSSGKVLYQDSSSGVVKTVLLDEKIIIGCFEISDDTKFNDIEQKIKFARQCDKQRHNIGYIMIFVAKNQSFNIVKFMEMHKLDFSALCDLRCFYIEEDNQLLTFYEKKVEFSQQVTEKLLKLLTKTTN